MARSLRIKPKLINSVKSALPRNGFQRQRDLAEDLQLSLATVSNFLNGRPVDYLNFYEICQKLGLDLQEIADFGAQENDSSSSALEVEPDQVSADVVQEQAEAEVSNYVDRPPIESRCYETILQPG